jgi:hypothetical protein
LKEGATRELQGETRLRKAYVAACFMVLLDLRVRARQSEATAAVRLSARFCILARYRTVSLVQYVRSPFALHLIFALLLLKRIFYCPRICPGRNNALGQAHSPAIEQPLKIMR